MPSKREQVLSALFDQLRTMALATVNRNEALPQIVPAAGLVILRDGDSGEPDVTLNQVHLFFSHRAEIEAFVSPPAAGGGEALLDALLGEIGAALAQVPDHLVPPWRPHGASVGREKSLDVDYLPPRRCTRGGMSLKLHMIAADAHEFMPSTAAGYLSFRNSMDCSCTAATLVKVFIKTRDPFAMASDYFPPSQPCILENF